MIKKSIATAYLLATAVSACSSVDNQYSFMIQPPHGKRFAVQRTEDGIFKIEMGKKEDPIPSQSLTLTCAKPQPGEDEDLEIDTTLTPRSSRNVLEQVGDVTDLLPWLPWEMTRDMLEFEEDREQNKTVNPEQVVTNNSISDWAKNILKNLASQNRETGEEVTSVPYAQTSQVMTVYRYNEAFTDSVTGKVTTYDITKEKHWIESLTKDFSWLDVNKLSHWYRSQHRDGSLAGLNDVSLMLYVWHGKKSGADSSVFQQFTQEQEIALEKTARSRTKFPDGPIDFTHAVFATQVVSKESKT